ncbi:MAG: hypothetical protein P1S60_04645 [Anaerolineae bacterium]|nr:hypothetical protein [Anaerolineae bacterium]
MPDPTSSSAKFDNMNNYIDLAQFAQSRWWTGTQRHDLAVHPLVPDGDGLLLPAQDPESGTWHWGLEWDEPRDIRQVVVRFLEHLPDNVIIQYWQKVWPTPAPQRLPGARRGWIGCDDPWHGKWVTVRAEKITDGKSFFFIFDPIDHPELKDIRSAQDMEQAEHYLARFRRTLKLRIVCVSAWQPRIQSIHAYSYTRWAEGKFDIYFGIGAEKTEDWSGWAECTNGTILTASPINFDQDSAVQAGNAWHCLVRKSEKSDVMQGVRLHVRYGSCAATSTDSTIVTLHTNTRSFSFQIRDLDNGPVYIKDYGVYITGKDGEPLSAYLYKLAIKPLPIYDRVSEEPEQSLARATREIPTLDVELQNSYTGLGRYLPLGVEAGRQEFAIRHNGELFADKDQLKLAGRDAAHLLWPGHHIRFRYGTGDPPDFREKGKTTQQSLLDGWLPVVISRWLDREIEVEQTTFVTLLDGLMTPPVLRNGNENIAAMQRFTMRNTTHARKNMSFWLAIAPQECLQLDAHKIIAHGRVVPADPVARQWRIAPYEEPCLRCTINNNGRGTLSSVPLTEEKGLSQAVPSAVLYNIDLDGGEAHSITINTPFISLRLPSEWDKVSTLDFNARLEDVVAYWRDYIDSGGQISVPDSILSDFHRAARVHVGIGVDKDPVNKMYVVPAATWSYGACGNEATWQITMLEQAGHHDRAEAYLETFLKTQGLSMPDGLFSSAEGALLAMNMDAGTPEMGGFGYNLDHGYIMECLAHHYLYTRDEVWLHRVMPNLIAACDFVIRERQRTKVLDSAGQPDTAWGLLPAGHLEDNPEWRHWFAVNAHTYAGMRAIANVLDKTGHPEAHRLQTESDLYRADIRAAVRKAIVASPAIQLQDGTFIPHVPTRTGIRGRERGWFREAAYGPLHLMEGYVYDPEEEEMTWVLKDLEDNLFVSREWGRPVDFEKFWFSHGGVTIQPNLMDLGIDYLRRGQIKHALRALFNNFGTSLYSDVRVFTEHPVVELGHGVGPFYKSPDECKALIWLRHCLLHEEGNTLHLAIGAPLAWFEPGRSFGIERMATLLGSISYCICTDLTQTNMDIDMDTDHHIHALILHIRLNEGKQIQAVTVNSMPHFKFNPDEGTITLNPITDNLSLHIDITHQKP